MKLTVVGCGDAFGSGGRLQTCYHVESGGTRFLIDCGASSMIGLSRLGLSPDAIDTVFLSHLHGDHFAGLVWMLLHAQYVSRRTRPLTITGPVGVEQRFTDAVEVLFPLASKAPRSFDMRFHEYAEGRPLRVGAIEVTPYEVRHPSGAPPYALRLALEGKVLAFSGDTEWVENVAVAGRGADLLLIECYQWDIEVRAHMAWQTLAPRLPAIGAKRIVLTHMAEPMLARVGALTQKGIEFAEDGKVFDI